MTIFSKIKNLIPLFLLIFHVYLLYIPELKGNYVWHHILLFGIELTIPLYLYFGKTSSQNYVSKRAVVLLAGIFVFIQISTLHTAKHVLKQFPEHVSLSDVVPQVDTMATRFLNHQYPYHPIVFGEATSQWTMHPTYMPMQWLPYSLPVYFHLDIRWFALLLFCLSIGIVFWKLRNQITLNTTLLFLCLPLLLYLIVWNKEAVKTVEAGIVALYILIPVFIWKKQYLLTGILITLCLLSRFTIIYWVPFYLLVLFFKNKKLSVIQFLIMTLGLLALYIIPFLWQHPSIFREAMHHHSTATVGEWSLYNEYGLPYNVFSGQGLAFLFFKLNGVSLEHRIFLLQVTQFALCTFALGLMLVYYIKRKSTTTFNLERFLIASFMVYLVLFYNFIQIPYQYLFLVPAGVLISGSICLMLPQQKQ